MAFLRKLLNPRRLPDFSDMAAHNFGFLLDEYGFTEERKRHLDGLEWWDDAEMIYQTERTRLTASLERADVDVRLGPAREPPVAMMPLMTVLDVLTHGKNEDFIPSAHGKEDYRAWVDDRLGQLAAALRAHCQPLLRGDFDGWLAVAQAEHRKFRDAYRAYHAVDPPANDLERYILYLKGQV